MDLSPSDKRFPPMGNTFHNFEELGDEAENPKGLRRVSGQRRRSWSGYIPFDLQDMIAPDFQKESADCFHDDLDSSCSTALGTAAATLAGEGLRDTDTEMADRGTETLETEDELGFSVDTDSGDSDEGHRRQEAAGNAFTRRCPSPAMGMGQVVMLLPVTVVPQQVLVVLPQQQVQPQPPQQPEEQESPHDAAAEQEEVTTVMLHNLPRRIKQQELLDELDTTGFAGLYDFCYIPRIFASGDSKGFGFVNFDSPALARSFMAAWQRQRRCGVGALENPVTVSKAKVQGLAKNLSKWDTPRLRRIRNPDFHPFVRGAGPRATPCEPAIQAMPCSSRTGPAGLAAPQRAGP